jgi:uncharacterized glyoxalase superfamily protein PhnB
MAAARPVLNQLNLVVRDMEATLAFYRRLGVDIPDAAVWRTAGGAHHAEVAMPNGADLEFDSVALAAHYDAGWTEAAGRGGPVIVGFTLPTREAVDECYGALTAAGHPGLQPPYDTFWGARYAVVGDPDGNHVGLMSPIDPARRTAPPAL